MRLAYADPPYPGKAHLYPENTEVDHAELIARLGEYDGWALSTDEVNLAGVLALCPPKTRVLAWCRAAAPPLTPQPYRKWEPVLLMPARTRGVLGVPSFLYDREVLRAGEKQHIVGRKTRSFCEWFVRALGAVEGDTLDDLFPGSGLVGATFARVLAQPPLFTTDHKPSRLEVEMMAGRTHDPLPGMTRDKVARFQPHTARLAPLDPPAPSD